MSAEESGNGNPHQVEEAEPPGAWALLAHPYLIKEFCPGAFRVNEETGKIALDTLMVIREMFAGQTELLAFVESHEAGWYISPDYRPGGADPNEYRITLNNVIHIIRESLPKELTDLPWYNTAKATITPDSVCKPDLGQEKAAFFFVIRFTPGGKATGKIV